MATTFESLEYEFYINGTSGASQIVGNDGDGTSKPRVVRYTFTTPAEGANSISFSKGTIGAFNSSSSTSEELRFYITDDPDDYVKADATYSYHGKIVMSTSGEPYTATGSVSNLILLPGKVYYLFIFPAYTSFGCWNWNYPDVITLTLSGAAGLVRIHNGTKFVNALPYIHNGSKWQLAIPHVHNGSTWKISS